MWAVFGYFLRYPKAGVVMVKYWLSICYKNDSWLSGEKYTDKVWSESNFAKSFKISSL